MQGDAANAREMVDPELQVLLAPPPPPQPPAVIPSLTRHNSWQQVQQTGDGLGLPVAHMQHLSHATNNSPCRAWVGTMGRQQPREGRHQQAVDVRPHHVAHVQQGVGVHVQRVLGGGGRDQSRRGLCEDDEMQQNCDQIHKERVAGGCCLLCGCWC